VNTVRLEIADFRSPEEWLWRLLDADGSYMASHEVRIARTDPEHTGFIDVRTYLERVADRADPKRAEREDAALRSLGKWIHDCVLGTVADALVKQAEASPTLVTVSVPRQATELLTRPFELAMVSGKPLASWDLTLAFEIEGATRPVQKERVSERLRMLALFSVPTDQTALALRRERFALKELVRRVVSMSARAVELRVLQYGVTRERLTEVVEEGASWDMIHFSGHGLPGGLLLEKPDGSADQISSDELVRLLTSCRGRLKLVTLSACDSAAATAAETLQALGLETGAPEPSRLSETTLPGLAHELVARLDCAAIAMRYPVEDEFAIALVHDLYELLLAKGQPLALALQRALHKASEAPGVRRHLLSLVTPALFGGRLAMTELEAPRGKRAGFDISNPGMAYFPDEPPQFVGRTGALARASEAFAPGSKRRGVLFCGMAGGGKTSCALELAYRYAQDRFEAMAWYEAPKEGLPIDNALPDLGRALEQQLPDFSMLEAFRSRDSFVQFLPRLTNLLRERSVLIVLDNLESLLTPGGEWKDDRWPLLIQAAVRHGGLSRLVLTSRYEPSGLGDEILSEPVSGLTLGESVLLARQLENLGALMREGDGQDRRLVIRTLSLVQGNPKLIELANAQASDHSRLEQRLNDADAAWQQGFGRLESFFETGRSDYAPEDYLPVLERWTIGVAEHLPADSRALFHVLSVLQDSDRVQSVVADNWRVIVAAESGHITDLSDALEPLIMQGLVNAEQLPDGSLVYRIHSAVAGVGRDTAQPELRLATNRQLASYWKNQFFRAVGQETGDELGALVLQAGTRAAPYLLELSNWEAASVLLEQVIARDTSMGTLGAVVPLLERIAGVTAGTERDVEDRGVLAKALTHTQPNTAEALLRELLPQAVRLGRFEHASGLAADLINLLRRDGQLETALKLSAEKQRYSEYAGLGPWTALADIGWRLQIRQAMGENARVIEEVEELRDRLSATTRSDKPEAVTLWAARESILDCARAAALALEHWDEALRWNAEVLASKTDRGTPLLSRERSEFNSYGPLLAMGENSAAENLLDQVWTVFDRERYDRGLGPLYSAWAHLQFVLHNIRSAIEYEERALASKYQADGAVSIALSHANLALYYATDGDNRAAALHCVAATLLRVRLNSQAVAVTASAAAAYVRAAKFERVSFAALCETLGTRFGLEALCARIASGDDSEASLSAAMTLISDEVPRAPARPELNQIRVWVRQGRTDRSIARLVNDELIGSAVQHQDAGAGEALDYAALGETLERILGA
jgi:hypothetical protein